MDEKTRSNFELNIWNARTMTENQIYETCDDAMGTENHYCTPVPTRSSGIVRSTTQLVPTLHKNPIYRHGISRKSAMVIIVFVVTLLLLALLLGCVVFALAEIQRLQGEMGSLKGELADLRVSGMSDVGNLSLAISQERTSRDARLLELEEAVNASFSDLSEKTSANISQLESRQLSDLDILREILSANISAVASLSTMQYMDIALTLNSSFSNFSSEFDQFQNQYWVNFQGVQDNLRIHSSEINSTKYTISSYRLEAEDAMQNLSSTFASDIASLRADMNVADSALRVYISSIVNSTLANIEQLQSMHIADISRTEDAISQINSSLKESIRQISLYTMQNISALQDFMNASLSSLRSVTDNSIIMLRLELGRVEYGLSAATHSNITNLGSEVQEKLDALVSNVRENLTHLESLTDDRIINLTTLTQQDLSALQLETHSNLSEVVRATQYNISNTLNQSLTLLGQLEINVERNLSLLSTEIKSNEYEFETQINATLDILERGITQSRSELFGKLSSFHDQVWTNVTDLYITVGTINSSFLSELLRVQQDLASQSYTNISLLEADISRRLYNTETFVWGNITSFESRTQHSLEDFSNKTDHRLDSLQAQFQSSFSDITQATFNNISTLENEIFTSLRQLLLESQRNFSLFQMESSQELANVASMLQYNLTRVENATAANINKLQLVDSMTADLVGELDGNITRLLSNLHVVVAENISALSLDLQLELNTLNKTDMLLLTRLHKAEREIRDIKDYNNETEKDIAMIEGQITILIERTSSNSFNISLLDGDLRTFESSLNIVGAILNSSIYRLNSEIQQLSEESEQNFAYFNNYTGIIDHRLNVSIQETQLDFNNLKLILAGNITSFKLEINSTLRDLESIFYGNLTSLQSHVQSSFIDSEIRITELVLQINESIGFRIQDQSSQTQNALNALTEQHANDIIRMSNYVNTSIENLNNERETLSVRITNVSMLANSVMSDLLALGSDLELTRNRFMHLLQNTSAETQESLVMVTSVFSLHSESAMNVSRQLQETFEANLTALQGELTSSIADLENETLTLTSQLNSRLNELSSNTTQSRINLQIAIHQTETALSTKIGNLTMETAAGFTELADSVSHNLTKLYMQLDTLSTNSSTSYTELNQNIVVHQQTTNSFLTTLSFSLNNLTQFVELLESNVSSVGNEVKQVKDDFESFSNSPLSLYDGCMEDSVECSLRPSDSPYYSGSCSTDSRPINITGYYTVDTKCDYQSDSTYVSITSHAMIRTGDGVSCKCSIFAISNGGTLAVVAMESEVRTSFWKCTLKLIRCPMSVNRR